MPALLCRTRISLRFTSTPRIEKRRGGDALDRGLYEVIVVVIRMRCATYGRFAFYVEKKTEHNPASRGVKECCVSEGRSR